MLVAIASRNSQSHLSVTTMIDYPQRLKLAQLPTPFYPLDRYRAALQKDVKAVPRIWVKRDDLTGCLTSGNKVRKLEFLLAEAKSQGSNVLITSGGVQSNHCRAVAVLGAQLGFQVHLLLRLDRDPDCIGNLLIDQLTGAEISYYSPQQFNRLDDLFDHWQQHYAAKGLSSYSIPTGGSNGTGLWGYIAAAQELQQDFHTQRIKPRQIVHATGSGGTQAGLTLGCNLLGLSPEVVGYAVCDDRHYFERKIHEDILSWREKYAVSTTVENLNIQTDDQFIGPGYGVAEPPVFELIKALAKLEGIVLDPVYTGKAFYGMVETIKQGRFSANDDIVFMHTGGFFGLLAQQQLLNL